MESNTPGRNGGLAISIDWGAMNTTSGPIAPDGYFLSRTNPLANIDQRDCEAMALRVVISSPQVRQMRAKVEAWFRIAAGRDMSIEMEATLPNFIDEYTFHYAVIAANSDPGHPRVTQVFAPAHEWFGMKLPGSEFGDNPDNSYRIIPVDDNAHYEVTVRPLNPGLDVTYTLIRGSALTHGIATLEERDLQANADGSYTLTLDATPTDGRRNHLQLQPGVHQQYLYVRDTRSDWRQAPNQMTVRRTGPSPAAPRTEQQIAELAVTMMLDDMPITYWFTRCLLAPPPNAMPQPKPPGSSGGLFVQLQSHGSIALRDNEAMVITLNPRGAAYHNLAVYDHWFVIRDMQHHTSSLNNAQSMANDDGTYTYVVSIEDPGVHNWIDTVGLHNVLVQNRNQGLPRDVLAAGAGVTLDCRLVRLKDLKSALPPETKWVTAAERQHQLAERLAQAGLRFVDG